MSKKQDELLKQVTKNASTKEVTKAIFGEDTKEEPKKLNKNVRGIDVHFRVSEEEREKLDSLAAASECETISQYIRKILKREGM